MQLRCYVGDFLECEDGGDRRTKAKFSKVGTLVRLHSALNIRLILLRNFAGRCAAREKTAAGARAPQSEETAEKCGARYV